MSMLLTLARVQAACKDLNPDPGVQAARLHSCIAYCALYRTDLAAFALAITTEAAPDWR